MYGIRHKNLYVDIATYPNLPSSAEKCPVNNSQRDVCHGGQSCVCSQCSIADHAQKLKHSLVMWMETTVRDRYIGQSYWDTHYSAKSCNGAEKYSTLGWKRKNKNNMLNTLAIKRDFFKYHICVTLGSVQRLNLTCTQPNPFNYCETHKTVNTRNIYGMLLCCEK